MTVRDATRSWHGERAAPPAPASPDDLAAGAGPAVEALRVSVYEIPTDAPESDGTIEWDSTTAVVVEAVAGGHTGLGWSYTSAAAARVIRDELTDVVRGRSIHDIAGGWEAMRHAVRNMGQPGIVASAISCVDAALWDLKARTLDLPLCRLLGMRRDHVPVYGSGGFTSYDEARLRDQLGGWAAQGMRFVKMKVGRDPDADPHRIAIARDAIGDGVDLFIDANGAYTRRGAAVLAHVVRDLGVTWFEEPVSGDDLAGLRWVREHVPPHTAIAAGEYAWNPTDVRRLLDANAVDVVQVDATRCCGITGFLLAAALCEAAHVPLSAHTAPALHLHVCTAAPRILHIEYFHDHARIERLLFDGVCEPVDGALHPDLQRAGTGLTLRRADIERYRTS